MNFSRAIKQLLILSWPIILGQVGLMLISVGDVYVATKFSVTLVAAIGVANGLVNPLMLFGVGLMFGISPTLSYERGQGRSTEESLSSIVVYSLVSGFFLTLITLLWNQFIPYLGLDERIIPQILEYCEVVAWSFPFVTCFQAIKEYLQAKEEVLFPNLASITAVGTNLALNYILVFGFNSFEGYGAIGLAYGSFLTRLFLFVVLISYLYYREKFGKVSFELIKRMFKFSLPIAFMFFLEVLAFCLVGILSGKLGVISAAANNIVLNISSTLFMIPMAISSAVGVKIGHAYGAKDIKGLRLYINASLLSIVIYSIFTVSTLIIGGDYIMNHASNDQSVIALGIELLVIVAIFQFVDSIQVVLVGILRGVKETKIPTIILLLSFWVFGIPYGVYLTFWGTTGVKGLWIGLAISLGLMALALFIILRKKLSKLSSI
jgi:MATE family multidrug resistance protein